MGGGANDTRERVIEALREEWEALGDMSYTCGNDGLWRPDIGGEDIGKIRVLLHESAAALAESRNATEEGH